MNSIKMYLAGFFAGLVAGVLLVERWRRTGSRLIAAEEDAPHDADAANAGTTRATAAAKPKPVASIVAGAKADAGRARQVVNDVVSRSGSAAQPPVYAESSAGS